MTTTRHETTVTAETDVPGVTIVREFDAPPAAVLRAHTDAELVARWMGPHGYDMAVTGWDCRTGGSYRYVHTHEGEQYAFHGCFHEVRPDERIVQTFSYEGMPDSVTLDTLVLTDLGGGRTRITGTSMFGSYAERAAMLDSGMQTGVGQGYERLDELLGG